MDNLVHGTGWLRSDVSFESGALTSVRLEGAQGDLEHVWPMHRDGPRLRVTTLPLPAARAVLLGLSA